MSYEGMILGEREAWIYTRQAPNILWGTTVRCTYTSELLVSLFLFLSFFLFRCLDELLEKSGLLLKRNTQASFFTLVRGVERYPPQDLQLMETRPHFFFFFFSIFSCFISWGYLWYTSMFSSRQIYIHRHICLYLWI